MNRVNSRIGSVMMTAILSWNHYYYLLLLSTVPGWITVFGGKLSPYVTSHPGQLSLAIPPWVGEMSTSLGWDGNRRSGIALAMGHRQ